MTQHKLTIVHDLATLYPSLRLTESDSFYWSPESQTVHYNPNELQTDEGCWAIIHESGHALLGHATYRSDFELLQLEVAAWEKAKEIATKLQKERVDGIRHMGKPNERAHSSPPTTHHLPPTLSIDEDHVQDCLDSYRDWLHRRSLCPNCSLGSIQVSPDTYSCIFCDHSWHVSSNRFCRPYRTSNS